MKMINSREELQEEEGTQDQNDWIIEKAADSEGTLSVEIAFQTAIIKITLIERAMNKKYPLVLIRTTIDLPPKRTKTIEKVPTGET
jgi:hypothetical protein